MTPLNKGKYSYNESVIYGYLRDNGFNDAQICGFLSNIEHESRFNPDISNKIGAYGLCQWLSGRKSTLFTLYGSKPTLQQQLSYIIYEITNVPYEKRNYEKHIKNIPNTREGAYAAGYNIAEYYERCEDTWNVPRGNRAREYWDHYVVRGASKDIVSIGNTSLISPSHTETSPSNIPAYASLATVDPYANYIEANLGRFTSAESSKYGHLIDMNTNEEFKFYIPEFSESAGANWGDIEIPGRSVTIKSYNSTNSRIITINLDLYAGVGVYTEGGDVVGRLHADMNFVKSLEYPDYSNFIVRPPSNVHLILGSNISMVGIVSNVNVEHLKPLDSQNRSMYVKLSFTVTQVAFNPPGFQDIRRGDYTVNSTTDPDSMNRKSNAYIESKMTNILEAYHERNLV